jgi:hypothetical protein
MLEGAADLTKHVSGEPHPGELAKY